MEFPKLDSDELKKMFREKGMLYTIEYSKLNRKKFPKNVLSGLNTKIKIIKVFVESLKDKSYEKDRYKKIDINIWKKLAIELKELSNEDKLYNKQNQKLPLMSEDLSEYIKNKYDDSKLGKQSFTKHTTSSPHIFWSIMLGVYSGARAEELAQINLKKDLKVTSVNGKDIYYFYLHVSDHNIQSLKNDSSSRNIPISDYLIELGFLNYINEQIKNKQEYLFNLGLNDDGKRKAYQRNFNETFKKFFIDKYPDKIGKRPTYHSLRAYFVSRFLKDEKNEMRYNLINLKKLIGHTSDDLHKDVTINSYYQESLEIEFAKKLIDDMEFHIDDGYNKIKSLICTKYPIILYSLNLD